MLLFSRLEGRPTICVGLILLKFSLLQLPSNTLHLEGKKSNMSIYLSRSCLLKEVVPFSLKTYHSKASNIHGLVLMVPILDS
jgi:hypothetical protein